MAKEKTRNIEEIYHVLRAHYGWRDWWPGNSPLEIVLGAILTQNTAWRNVEKAIANLRRARALSLKALRGMPRERLAELIRSSGYYNQKAIKIKDFIAFLDERYGGSIARMGRAPWPALREELLAVRGIGPETADSILLYALGQPTFVIDAYTQRVMKRHGWAPPTASYEELRAAFMAELPADEGLYNDYHAQLVSVGHHHCRKTPKCEGCPLAPLLPRGGPLPGP